jgi:hypothetical protein
VVNKVDITVSYASRKINRQPEVVCRTGGQTLLAAAGKAPWPGFGKKIFPGGADIEPWKSSQA